MKTLRYLLFILLISPSCKFSKFTTASDVLSKTTDPISDNNTSSQASSCSVSISKNDFSLSETVAINLNSYGIQSLSYNINFSNDWFSIPASAINSRQIIIQAADLGTGSFHFRVRAQDQQQALIECQGNLLIQVRSVINPVSSPTPNPSPIPSPSPALQSTPQPTNTFIDNHREYQAVVGPGNFSTSFKMFNDPHRTVDDLENNLYRLREDRATNTLQIRLRVDGTTNSKLKFFFPPGTRSIGGSFLLANRTDIPAIGIMRMHSPPNTPLSQVTLDKAFSVDNAGGDGNEFGIKILTNLLTPNKEVYFYGLAGGGGLPIAYGGYYLDPIPRSGGWVYGHFQYPSGRLATGNFGISVDKDCYINWYNNARWDADGNPREDIQHSCRSM